jgi:hypothetical protein
MRAMAGASGESGLSLTGLWNGLFSYPRIYGPTSFVAILVDSGASFSGTTHERGTTRRARGGILYAMLQGRRAGTVVSFTKTYDGTGNWTHSVEYEGRLNADWTEIDGRWRIAGLWSGSFLMLRPRSKAGSVELRIAETVGGR